MFFLYFNSNKFYLNMQKSSFFFSKINYNYCKKKKKKKLNFKIIRIIIFIILL
jgi:hypothetical protein